MTTFPNVPIAPGVPALPRDPAAPIVDDIVIALADAVIIARMFTAPSWGLFFDDGTDALNVSSTVAVEFRADAGVTTAPLERGAFVSYNKVQAPQLIRMSFAISNGKFLPPGVSFGAPDISEFLLNLEDLRTQATLLTAVTPDAVYDNMTVMHFEYRRSAEHNATMLVADVWLQEIRQPGAAQFTSANVKSPSSPDPVHVGTVQPVPVGPFANELPLAPSAAAGGGGFT